MYVFRVLLLLTFSFKKIEKYKSACIWMTGCEKKREIMSCVSISFCVFGLQLYDEMLDMWQRIDENRPS